MGNIQHFYMVFYIVSIGIVLYYSMNTLNEYPNVIVSFLSNPVFKCVLYALIYPITNFDLGFGLIYTVGLLIADNQVSLILNS